MSLHRFVPLLAVIVACTFGCREESSGKQSAPSSEHAFAPTADSSLTPQQVGEWLQANKALDSLAFAYQDSFNTDDANKRRDYQEQFSHAQDALCRSVGMVGGHVEYRWITEALAKPINEALRDSFEISAHLSE